MSNRVALALLLLGACSTSAPSLPPARQAVTAQPSPADPAVCAGVLANVATIDAKMREANARIEAERPRNQTAGYVAGMLFPPAILAVEFNSAERAAVRQLYSRRDEQMTIAAAQGCSLPSGG